MRRLSTTLLALAAGATMALPALAGAADGHGAPAPRAVGSVSALSIVPGAGKTEVIINVQGDVDVQDFTLSAPQRVVIDLRNATLSGQPVLYDKISRGGITNVRMAQFKQDVVRIVLELDGPRNYTVIKGTGDLRVAVEGAEQFAMWSSAAGAPAAAVDRTRGRAPAAAVADAVVAPTRTFRADGGGTPKAPVAQPRITVTYQDADIKEVITAFASFARRTIVVGRAVTGQVTTEIIDQPWDVALQAILKSQGLDASEDASSGIITVDSYANLLTKQASEPLATQMVKLNYANASSIRATVLSLLSRDCSAAAAAGGGAAATAGGTGCVVRGSVVSDSGTNSLLVTDVPSRMADLLTFMRDLDFRTPQVAIKAKIISVDRTRLEELGLKYDLRANTNSGPQCNPALYPCADATGAPTITAQPQIALGGNVITGLGNAATNVPGATLQLVLSTLLGNYQLTSFLDAAKTLNVTDIQAEPSIVTLDNRPATIFSGQEVPFRVVDAGASGTGAARATTRTVEAGISLSVTPHITNNRQVLLTLSAENSTPVPNADVGFTITRSRANDQLLVNDGETAVIGGLTVTTVGLVREGIPILMDIPFIGRLFSHVRNTEQKKDLLILVTPHILDDANAPPPGPGR